MEVQSYPSHMNFHYHVCAVLFGTDATLLNVPLSDEFSFVRRSLNPKVDHLDKIFGRDDIGLRRDYEQARIDSNTMDVICIERDLKIDLDITCADAFYDQEVDKDLIQVDDFI